MDGTLTCLTEGALAKRVSDSELKMRMAAFEKTTVATTEACLAKQGLPRVDLSAHIASDGNGKTVYASPAGLDVTVAPEGQEGEQPRFVAKPRNQRRHASATQGIETGTEARKILENCVSDGAVYSPPPTKP